MTPLRQRYIDDLRLKNFSAGTIKVYVHAVAKFARHYGRSPEKLSQEEVRAYLVHLIERGVARSTGVVIRNALRHLFTDTLGRPDCVEKLPRPKREQRLPEVLSREEVRRLFASVTNLKQKALFMVAYDAGLRLSEISNLRMEDIDSQRMVIRIRQGKGKKDRYARLTPHCSPCCGSTGGPIAPKPLVSRGTAGQALRPRHTGPTPEEGMPQGGHHQAGQHAYVAAQFCHASLGGGRRSACDPAVVGPRTDSDDGGLHAHVDEELREAPSLIDAWEIR